LLRLAAGWWVGVNGRAGTGEGGGGGSGAAARLAPQLMQKRVPDLFPLPHFEQKTVETLIPYLLPPQRGQRMHQ